MALPVSFRWDEGFVARIDAARGLVPRSAWVRRAVEQALGHSGMASDSGSATASRPDPAPAERPYDSEARYDTIEEVVARLPEGTREATVPVYRRRREFRPYPKGGQKA